MTPRWIDNQPFRDDLAVWTRAFANELLPSPVTPLGWEIVWVGAAASGWRDALVDRLGFEPDEIDEVSPEGIGLFGGYAYLNASALRIWSARTPALAPNHIDTAYLVEHLDMPTYIPATWHDSAAATERLSQWLSWVLVDQSQSELEAGHVLSIEARADRPDLAELSDPEVLDRALGLRPLCRALVSQYVNQTLAASIGPGIIAAICDEIGLPTSATAIISGIGDVESVSPAHALWTLSRLVRDSIVLSALFDSGVDGMLERVVETEEVDIVSFLAGLDALAAEVGFRGTDEWEPAGRTIETDPTLALEIIDRLRRRPDGADPAIAFAQREAERRTLVKEVGDAIAKNSATKEHFDAAVAATDTFIRGRERAKSNVSRVIHEIRVALAELGNRAARRGDIADPTDIELLFTDELAYYADGGLSMAGEITAERRIHRQSLAAVEPPFIVKAPPVPPGQWAATERPPLTGTGDVLYGKPGSAGVGRGRARVITDRHQPVDLVPGDVLVIDSLPAVWAPLLIGIAGLVVESGGLLSHSTIISRELSVPTVVRAQGATARIGDGALIEVDGSTGLITIIEDSVFSDVT